jgi:hypothetical protein
MTFTREIHTENCQISDHSHRSSAIHANGQESTFTFNDIPISDAIINHLKMNSSAPISRLSKAEIEEAVIGFEGDANIIEDEKGHTLSDKMHHTWDEELPDIQSIHFVVTEAGYWVNSIHAFTSGASIHYQESEHATEKSTEENSSFVERYLASKNSSHHFTPALSFL